MAKNWALVIGINEYNPLNFAPLKYAKRDAEQVKAFFETAGFERVFFFSDDSPRQTLPNGIEIPTQATYGNLISFLQGFFEQKFLDTGDNFWFFFAGHGERYHDEDYLMPMDANSIGSEVITGLRVNYVRERICRCGADNIILILDACRSQGSRDGSGLGLEVQPGVITITSCQPKQKSWEVDELGQGVFTYALLEALQLGGEQSCATVERLGSYLHRRVPELCQRYGKAPAQVPRVGADPIEKQHFILIPQYARQADLDLLKLDAYRLCKTDPALAESICLRLNALAMGRDLEVIDLLTDLRRQSKNLVPVPSEPTPPPHNSALARSATTAATTTIGNDLEGYAEDLERQRQEQVQQQAQAQQQAAAQRRRQEQAEAKRQQQEAEAEQKRQAEANAQRQREEAERQKQAEAERQKRAAEAEQKRQAKAQQQRKEAERQKQAAAVDQDDLSSERFRANYYAKLRDLLAAQDWKAADQETAHCMCEVMDRPSGGWLRLEDIKKFPCLDLRNIDSLWVKYSQGKFGFSVQKEIWQNCGSPTDYNKDWEKFGVVVGWRTKGIFGRGADWVPYSQFTFKLTAPRGHLPRGEFGTIGRYGQIEVFSRSCDSASWEFFFSSLASRLVNCSG